MTDKRRRGRPTKLTQELMAEMVAICQRGCYMETAAASLGISVETVRDWMKKGAKEADRLTCLLDAGDDVEKFMTEPDLLLAEFSGSIKAALADAELDDLDGIGEAGRKQWQARAWRLERMHPSRYALRARLEHTGSEGGPIRHEMSLDLTKLSDEQLAELEQIATIAGVDSKPGDDSGGEGST